MKIAQKKKTQSHTGMSREKLDPRKIHKSYLESMEDDLSKKGVVFFDADNGLNIDDSFLQLPSEITDIPSKELGEYLSAFTQQKVYLRTILGRAELLEEEARREYYGSTETLYKKFSNQKLSETAKDRVINSDPDVKPLLEEYQDCRKKVALIKYSIENIEDIVFLLSREVTRRNSDFDDEGRSYNVNSMRNRR